MSTREQLSDALAASGLPEWLRSWAVQPSKGRTRTVTAIVEPTGRVVFACPAGAAPQAVVTAVHAMLPRVRERLDRLRVPELVNGEGFLLFDRSYRLKLVHDGPAVELRRCPLGQRRPGDDVQGSMGSDWFLCLRRDAANPRNLIDWYATQLGTYAVKRMGEHAERLGIPIPARLEIRTGGKPWRKWGTYLHTTRVVTLNWQLAQAPRRLVDYVIAHETAHASAPNERLTHGPRWEANMTRLVPNWKACRTELNDLAAFLWTGGLAQGWDKVARDAVRAERFAGKFAADTVNCGTYVEPTDEALALAFADCVNPADPDLYPLIRNVFHHRYQPATGDPDLFGQLAADLEEVTA